MLLLSWVTLTLVMWEVQYTDKVMGGEGGMSATEGIREYEVGPGLVVNREGEGPEGCDEPYLMGARCEGGVRGPPHLEVVGGGSIVCVDNEAEAGGDVWAEGPHGEDEVEGLELVDVGLGMGEVGVVFFGAASLLIEGRSCTRSPIRGEEMDAVPPLGICTEPVDVLSKLGSTSVWPGP